MAKSKKFNIRPSPTFNNMPKTPSLEDRVLNASAVQKTIDALAKRKSANGDNAQVREQLQKQAKDALETITANLNPLALALVRPWEWLIINFSFNGVEVHGFEQARPVLEAGQAVIACTHFSYYDLAALTNVLLGHGKNYYLGGDNVARPPAPDLPFLKKAKANFVRWEFRNVGLVQIKREVDIESFLRTKLELSYTLQLLMQGNNVATFAGNSDTGRYKSGEIPRFVSVFSSVFVSAARYAVPLSFTYTIVPEDEGFAHKTDEKHAGVESVSGLQRWDRAYGKIHVVFGKPIEMARYQAISPGGIMPKSSIVSFQRDVNAALVRQMTLTPVNLASVAAMDFLSGHRSQFSIGDIERTAFELASEAKLAGVNLAPNLDPTKGVARALRYGAGKLAWRGALQATDSRYKVADQAILEYYANHIRPTLHAFKIS